jgi:predicted DNA-binding transcriptional regulator AlpA
MSDAFELGRVVPEPEARKYCGGLGKSTWQRLRAAGQAPPVVQLSKNRIGYRIADLQKWVESRRTRP